MAAFPNVPNAPGVPPLRRNPLGIVNSATLAVADAQFLFSLFGPPKWGIYSVTTGELALFPDSIFAVEFRNDSDLSTFPIENGGFQSYNKVSTPFDVKVTMVKSGSDSARGAFLAAARAVAASIDLYDIVTPDITLSSANVNHWSFTKNARNGVSLIVVEMWFEEVRVGGDAAFSNTAQPTGTAPVSTGTVQALPPDFTPVPPPVPVVVSPL